MVYFITDKLAMTFINNVYFSDEAIENRTLDKVEEFSRYVSKNKIKSDDMNSLLNWQNKAGDVYILVCKNNELIFNSTWWDDATIMENMYQEDELILIDDASDEYKFYPIKFADGVYDVCVIDYGDYDIYNIAYIVEFALSCLVFMSFLLWYNKRLINRVARLSTEIADIKNNDINAPITKTGRDELQVLSENIDSMRATIIEQLSNEREAWQANRDLVTSMAHDIRTPLTVLNGYLDLLNEKEYDSEETLEEYLSICSEKAAQLKDLSDKLFRYFFVYSGKKDDLNFEIYDATELFQQMLGEYIILLREKGYEFKVVKLTDKVNIRVDSIYLKRLFDNVFTNIRKYAEAGEPINVTTVVEASHVILTIENVISSTRNEAESTKMGIKTCEKVAQEMNMIFRTEESAGKYKVSVIFNIEE
jgi:signal transduction histidine kinase